MAYETFEHTADVGIRGIGRTLEQAYEEAAKAMFSVMVDIKAVKPVKGIKLIIQVGGLDNTGLFIEWLNRLLAEKDMTGMMFSKFKVKITDDKLVGTVWGESFDPKKHKAEVEVKAATYSQLKVEKKKNKWIAQCIVDV